jgi:predicted ester cyclase
MNHDSIDDTGRAALATRLETELQAVRALYRAFGDHDPDLLDQAVVPGWNDLPLAPGQGPGPDGLKPIIRGLIAALPDLGARILDVIQVPGRIAVRAELTGTHRGPLFGIAATNKPVTIRLHDLHELDGHRIVTTWHMEDWHGLFVQLGSFPSL